MLPLYVRQLRSNQLIESYRNLKILYMIAMVMNFFFVVAMAFTYLMPSLTMNAVLQFLGHGGSCIYVVLVSSFTYVNNAEQLFYWRKIEPRRMEAVRRRDLWNAAEQPVANPTALPLPATIITPSIKQAGPRSYSEIIFVVFVSALFFGWLSSNMLVSWLDRWHGFLISFAAIALLLGCLIIILAITVRNTKIFVTEQGVKIGKTLIRWEEVELFAIYHAYIGKRPGISLTYELSSATDILRWNMAQGSPVRFVDVEPRSDVANSEQRQRLQALSEVVVARTGLPLSDLRDR